MFNIFGRRTTKDFMEEAKETYSLPEPKQIPPMPEIAKPKDDNPGPTPYTVGPTPSGDVAIRIQAKDGFSMTMVMNSVATRQFIRVLEAAISEEDKDVETDRIPD